jgi:biopolymer transport protein ExbB
MDLQRGLDGIARLGSGWVLWALVGLSVIGLAVILERALYFAIRRDDASRLAAELRELLLGGDVEAARRRLGASRAIEATVAVAGLDAEDAEVARERIAGAKHVARAHMERHVAFLGTLGNNAPFIGLLGTVIGIVRAFQELDRSAGQVSAGLMAEIGEALLATAMGLFVALPAVACFNVFQRLIRARLAQADTLAREVTAYHLSEGRTGVRAAAGEAARA